VLPRRKREVQWTLARGILLTCGHLSIDRIHVDRATSDAGYIAMIEEITFAIDCEGALCGRNLRFPADRFDDCLCIVPGHMERFRATSEDQQQSTGDAPAEQSQSPGSSCTSHMINTPFSIPWS